MPEGTTIYDAAKDAGIEIPVLCHDERYDPVGVCRVCVVDVGARVYAAACVRPCEDGMEVKTATPEVETRRATLTQLLMADQPPTDGGPEGDDDSRQRAAGARPPLRDRARGRPPARQRPRHRPQQPRDRGQPRRLHPVRPLRPRLRRHPGQRRDRPLRQGLLHADRVRPERPDGRVVVRDLRRVRGRLPDRRAREQADQRRADQAADRARLDRHGLPVLRRRLRAHLPRGPRAERDLLRGRPRAARLEEPPVREGPLRLGLRELAAAAHDAADPNRRVLPEGPAVGRREGRGPRPPAQARRARGLRRGAPPLPRGELGGGAQPRGGAAHRDPRRRRPGRDRRLRLGQVLERGGLPLPEADPRRLRHEQRGPLHAAVPRVERRGAVRGRGLGRGLHHLRRHRERRRGDPRRHEHDREPPGRVELLQAGEAARHDAGRGGPAARADRRPRRHLLPAQARHRRGLLQRDPARGDRERLGRPRVRRGARHELRRAREGREGVPARASRADLRRAGRHDPRRGAALGRGERGRHLLGHGDLAAHDRHRQRALPDRDVLDHGERGPAGHRACTRCAARTTCRARPTPG